MIGVSRKAAFTLIELLIVVAIIAILAAIAVPNFLEAQTRAKVSRCAADCRSIRTGLESYAVDSNHYPEGDQGVADLMQNGCALLRLSTPIAYMTSVPRSPFKEENMGYSVTPRLCNRMVTYLYVRAEFAPPGNGTDTDNNGITDNYEKDRAYYLASNDPAAPASLKMGGNWELKSVGPNNFDDRNTISTNARVYDPTNGTISPGDVIIFGDLPGFAGRS